MSVQAEVVVSSGESRAKVNARARRRGKDHERELRNHHREAGLDVEQLRQTGVRDEGDLVVRAGGLFFVEEAKNEAKIALASYVGEAVAEAGTFCENRGVDPARVFPVAAVKRRGKMVGESYMVMRADDYVRLLRLLDERGGL